MSICATLNMGMELEFDERALFDAKDSFYNRLVAYIDHFERQQAFVHLQWPIIVAIMLFLICINQRTRKIMKSWTDWLI